MDKWFYIGMILRLPSGAIKVVTVNCRLQQLAMAFFPLSHLKNSDQPWCAFQRTIMHREDLSLVKKKN